MRLVHLAAAVLLASCADPGRPELAGAYVPELRLVEPTPREILAQACLADWCPLVRPEVAAGLGCPPPRAPPASGYLWPDYGER